MIKVIQLILLAAVFVSNDALSSNPSCLAKATEIFYTKIANDSEALDGLRKIEITPGKIEREIIENLSYYCELGLKNKKIDPLDIFKKTYEGNIKNVSKGETIRYSLAAQELYVYGTKLQ